MTTEEKIKLLADVQEAMHGLGPILDNPSLKTFPQLRDACMSAAVCLGHEAPKLEADNL
jgi:hypothetical protein